MSLIIIDRLNQTVLADSYAEEGRDGFRVRPSLPKIHYAPAVGIYGWTGIRSNGQLFAEWLLAGSPRSERAKIEDTSCFNLRPDGQLFVYADDMNGVEVLMPFYCMGIGQDVAYGILAYGGKPLEAMRIATQFYSKVEAPYLSLGLKGQSEEMFK